MVFKPEKLNPGDSWHYSDGERVHRFYMQGSGASPDDPADGSIGHAVSEDMLHWTVLPPAILKGPPGSYDELPLWTGCTVKKDDTLYLFYTSRCLAERCANSISVAISKDGGLTWEKYGGNPVITPDPRYYYTKDNRTPLAVHSNADWAILDCRDLCVVWDEERGLYWGYFAARRPAEECTETSVIALAKSEDLLHWEQLPPCFCPDKYHCIETPDVFKMGDKWYMLCLSGNHYGQRNRTGDPNMFGRITVYGVADRPEGPYRECAYADNVLVGSAECSGHCAKTAEHRGKRYLFYTQTLCDGLKRMEFSLSPPKAVQTDETGRLFCRWFDGYESLYRDGGISLAAETPIPNAGRWGSVVPWEAEGNTVTARPRTDWAVRMYDIPAENFVLEAEIENENALSAGFIFDVNGDSIYADNRIVLLDFEQNEVWLTRARFFPKDNARRFPLGGNSFRLKVLAYEKLLEIYVNDVFVLHHMTERSGGRIGLYAETGTVRFRDPKLTFLK